MVFNVLSYHLAVNNYQKSNFKFTTLTALIHEHQQQDYLYYINNHHKHYKNCIPTKVI